MKAPSIALPCFSPGDRVWCVNGKRLFAATVEFAKLKVHVHLSGKPTGKTHWEYGLSGLSGVSTDTELYHRDCFDKVADDLRQAFLTP